MSYFSYKVRNVKKPPLAFSLAKLNMLLGKFFGLALLSAVWAESPKVKIGETTLIGRDVTLRHQDFFGAIPYAQPPTGELRLKRPVLKTTLDVDQFDARNFGLACPQPGLQPDLMSEDCLTINIFRPSGLPSTARLPVLFWTYGGGFQIGSSSLYNGSAIVAHSVARGTPLIYVNFNYRLGPLGFPQGKEADGRGALNLAIRDQVAALEWVQVNIGHFGGDRTKVTVFGQSAGSIMTSVLFLGDKLEKLARAAIFESGHAASALTYHADRREVDWQNFVHAVPSCSSFATSTDTFSCLQTAGSAEIIQGLLTAISEAPEVFGFDPTLDGLDGLYPDLPSILVGKGQFARIPFIAGTVLDEGTLFTPRDIASEDTFRSLLTANFSPPIVSPQSLGGALDTLFQLYPNIPALGSPFNTGNETFGLSSVFKQASAMTGDVSFLSQRRFWSEAGSRAGVKNFAYLFTEPDPTAPPEVGVGHAFEIPYVYGVVQNPSKSAARLSAIMIDYWVSFATSLDPNDGRGFPRPRWPQYTPNNRVLMQLNGANLTVIPDNFREKQTSFINSSPLTWHHRRFHV
ncbi:hypothetical protein AMATHDRAFT_60267 [Amanita thiersii Skay4041]|uniref:Carboxylic ester hydrolase n=1 Tax=Amanita thiersii Skay4041 TaxID=703135 RepID=A0A2A9NIK3_9AGAR|nr:hypothetical protein AMATHDRAFT_60267 [Amanita thiersii Skay4041]